MISSRLEDALGKVPCIIALVFLLASCGAGRDSLALVSNGGVAVYISEEDRTCLVISGSVKARYIEELSGKPLEEAVLPEGFELIQLPGHFFDMVGFRTPDDTVFLADCISSKETLDKYGISFIYDVEKHLETLDKVENMEAKFFVPAHAPAGESVKELAAYNRDKVYEAAEKIKNICAEPKNFEEILKRVFDEYNMQLTFEQYVLIGSTVRSYLAWMKDKGEMQAEINDNMLFWRK